MSIENQTYSFLKDFLGSLAQDDPLYGALYGAVLHKTSYGKPTRSKDNYIQIGPCRSAIAPEPGAEAMQEFNGELTLICLKRVNDSKKDVDNYAVARDGVMDLGKTLGLLFVNHPDMDGAVFDSLPKDLLRDFTSLDGEPFAVVNLILAINETDQQLEE